jgi:hypothetical protein
MKISLSRGATSILLLSFITVACVATIPRARGSVEELSSTSLSSIIFVIDTAVSDSDYILSAFNNHLLTFDSNGFESRAAFTNGTTFRNAQTDKFSPTDPCHRYAIAYNTAGAAVDATALFSAIASMTTNRCHANIVIEKSLPTPLSIRSFRPLP